MNYVFGIDLGTTYSCIAYMDEYGKPVVLKNSDGDHTTPSVVMVESADNVVVGMEAKRSIEVDPDRTVQFIKRKMGKENDKVTLAGITYSAPEISAYILKKLVKDANDELIQTGVILEGQEVRDVVITCPAYFGMNERQATKTAGELAGLNVLNIINEPTAAAISYGAAGSAKHETVLVYDLGGGTFDITVMDINGSDISVVCTGGDDTLGGKDWDETLMDYVTERYEEENGEDLSEDPDAVAALYVDVETWKKSLTAREKVNISVNGNGGRFREELTRERYEELTHDLLSRTKNLLDEVLKNAAQKGCPQEKIDKILLVGGSSRMPQVAKMIETDYHITPVLQDPDEAVAKGAAIYARNEKQYSDFLLEESQKTGKTVKELTEENLKTGGALDKKFALSTSGYGAIKMNITNVLSRTYGISAYNEDDDLVICNMLMSNDKLPATTTRSFWTGQNNQTGAELPIFETRSMEPTLPLEDREPITTIHMRFNERVPKGTEITVMLALDNSGILHVMAEELCRHSKLETTFDLSNQMTEDERITAVRRTAETTVE